MEGIEDALVEHLRLNPDGAPLDPKERAMLDFALKLTRTPNAMGPDDVAALHSAGWDDRSVSDIVQVTAYFNYINRVAEGIGVDLEPEMLARE